MKVVVTTGPSYEPVDNVRRLTNFSTGELGILLSEQLAAAGFDVLCLRGEQATHPHFPVGVDTRPFTTNDDLHEQLVASSRTDSIGAVFMVAALCDFKVAQVRDASGARSEEAKIDSRAGQLTIVLEPARKVLAGMRAIFPHAVIVGWKYELNGKRADALAKAWRQVRECRIDACVVNGSAWGPGFGLCTPPEMVQELANKNDVAAILPRWLASRQPGNPP